MERTTIASVFADQERLGGQTVTVCGWARTIRDMKGFGFVELNDGSCFKNLQIVLDANALDNYKEIAGQNVGASLIVTGTVVLTPPGQAASGDQGVLRRGGGSLRPRLPPAEEAPQRGVPAHHPAPAAPGPTCSPPPSGCARWPPTPSTASSRTGASSMSRPPSSPPATARGPARCSR